MRLAVNGMTVSKWIASKWSLVVRRIVSVWHIPRATYTDKQINKQTSEQTSDHVRRIVLIIPPVQ